MMVLGLSSSGMLDFELRLEMMFGRSLLLVGMLGDLTMVSSLVGVAAGGGARARDGVRVRGLGLWKSRSQVRVIGRVARVRLRAY